VYAAVSLVGLRRLHVVDEGYREGVQCGLPSQVPPGLAGALGVQVAVDEVQSLHRGLGVRVVASGLDRPPVPGVERFNRVGRAGQLDDRSLGVWAAFAAGSGVGELL
jgi:hypothetical protein